MYVCICHGVTEKDIQKAAKIGANSIHDLKSMTGCGTGCGSCVELAAEVLQAHHSQATPDFLTILKPVSDWQMHSQDQAMA